VLHVFLQECWQGASILSEQLVYRGENILRCAQRKQP